MTLHIPITAAPTIASIRAAWVADVARSNGTSAHVRKQAGYTDAVEVIRAQMQDAGGWARAILFDLLREHLTPEYADAVGNIEIILVHDGNGTAQDAIYPAESLLEFAREKYAIAGAGR